MYDDYDIRCLEERPVSTISKENQCYTGVSVGSVEGESVQRC